MGVREAGHLPDGHDRSVHRNTALLFSKVAFDGVLVHLLEKVYEVPTWIRLSLEMNGTRGDVSASQHNYPSLRNDVQ